MSGQNNKANLPERQKKKKRPPKKITESYLHNAGLYYLQRFAASSEHFRSVMMRKIDKSCFYHKDQGREECARMVDSLIAKFKALGLLDDASYCRAMMTSMRRRGLSARAIRAKLSARGLDKETIDHALINHDSEFENCGDMLAALRLARKRRIGPFQARDKEPDKNKAMSALARGGFSFDTARRVLDMSRDEAEEMLIESQS